MTLGIATRWNTTSKPLLFFSLRYPGEIAPGIHRKGHDVYQNRSDGPFPQRILSIERERGREREREKERERERERAGERKRGTDAFSTRASALESQTRSESINAFSAVLST